MSKIVWGSFSGPLVELGIDQGVIYPRQGPAVPWNGLISVDEDHSGTTDTIRFFDGNQYRNNITAGEYSATVTSYTYPDILDWYEELANGIKANAREGNTLFNFSYRTMTDKGYRIHLIYNASATPTTKSYGSLNSTPEAMAFVWEIDTVPVDVVDASPSSHLFVDSDITHPWILERLETMLYGLGDDDPRMPGVAELIEMFQDGSIFRVTDHGDGTWTATGPDDVINMLAPSIFEINVPTAFYITPDTYRISSY